SNNMGLERSGVQKAIKTLLETDLVQRKQKNITSGGYLYFYKSIPKNEISKRLMDIINEWEHSLRMEAKRWVSN
ncbi:MAG: hypothetical protein GXO64_01775, partial [Candidatus Micrarchaeota archaeon]|nr:hypothetical protein [Candidatus Micrarchaeota archaeon]